MNFTLVSHPTNTEDLFHFQSIESSSIFLTAHTANPAIVDNNCQSVGVGTVSQAGSDKNGMNEDVLVPSVMSQHVSECVPGQQFVDRNAKIGTELNNGPVVESDTAIHVQETSFFSNSRTKFKSKYASTEAAVTLTFTLPITKKNVVLVI